MSNEQVRPLATEQPEAMGESGVLHLDEICRRSVSAVSAYLRAVESHLGVEAEQDFEQACIAARPGKVWAETLTIARSMALALRGAEPEEPVNKMLVSSRVFITSSEIVNSEKIQRNQDKQMVDEWSDRLDALITLRAQYDENEQSLDEYQLGLHTHALYIADLLPARAASAQEASQILDALTQKSHAMKPLTREHELTYNLLAERVHEGITEEGIDGAIARANYILNGLDEDALPAAKLYVADQIIFGRLKNYIKSYVELEDYRDEKLGAWSTLNGTVAQMSEYREGYDPSNTADIVESVDFEMFKPMEVKWEVLPPGELLDHAKEIAEEMMEQAGEHTPPVIDPLRLKTLEKVREEWGADSAYYMKGALKRRHTVRDGQKECPDQYIVLILQENDRDGNIVEHAVAESPIAGPHAMYVYRQDVNPEASWREVMSLNKADARKLGARPLKHPSGLENGELVATMAERTGILLAATPEEFLRVEFNGSRIRIGQKLAIKAFAHLSTS